MGGREIKFFISFKKSFMPVGVLWSTLTDESQNFYKPKFERFTTYEDHLVYGVRSFEICTKFLNVKKTNNFVK
jgi:hypothetical protein